MATLVGMTPELQRSCCRAHSRARCRQHVGLCSSCQGMLKHAISCVRAPMGAPLFMIKQMKPLCEASGFWHACSAQHMWGPSVQILCLLLYGALHDVYVTLQQLQITACAVHRGQMALMQSSRYMKHSCGSSQQTHRLQEPSSTLCWQRQNI